MKISTTAPASLEIHADLWTEMSDLNFLCLMEFGSHLYGTNTPESDRDYKGVFVPTQRQILLGNIPKSVRFGTKKKAEGEKNTAADIDIEIYSLHYFIKLALEGQTVALDMLHAPRQSLVIHTPKWWQLTSHRDYFYTKNLKAFIGYARKQAAKYGIKGSRLADATAVVEWIDSEQKLEVSRVRMKLEDDPTYEIPAELKLRDVWKRFSELEHARIETKSSPLLPDEKFLHVCGRLIQGGLTLSAASQLVSKIVSGYGERARKAANNEGVDWKAISHAVRAAFVVRHILREGDFTYPLPTEETTTLRAIKAGNFDYKTEAAPLLETLIEELEHMCADSRLPTKPNRKAIEDWLVRMLLRQPPTEFYSHDANEHPIA